MQANATRKSYARAVAQVHERPDGFLEIFYARQQLSWQDATQETPTLRARGRKVSREQQPGAGSAEQGAEGDAASMLPETVTLLPLELKSDPLVSHAKYIHAKR